MELLHCIAAASPAVTVLCARGPVDTQEIWRASCPGNFSTIVKKIHPVLQAMRLACVPLKGLKALKMTLMTIHVTHAPVLSSNLVELSDSLEQLGISGFNVPGM